MEQHQNLGGLVRIKNAAELLGVSTQTIRNWVDVGLLQAIRHPVNGYRLFKTSDIQNLLSQNNETNELAANSGSCLDPSNDLGWLKAKKKTKSNVRNRPIRIGDAFCGGGIFSLGAEEACKQSGLNPIHAFGIDFDKDAACTYAANFPDSRIYLGDVLSLINGKFGKPLTDEETTFKNEVGEIDLLIGGPPCQGHSDLNNHTRRADPKNSLFFVMARMAEILNPKAILIENVPGVTKDKSNVVNQTVESLKSLGYKISMSILDLSKFGVPQNRKRFILVASRFKEAVLPEYCPHFKDKPRPLSWGIQDLLTAYSEEDIYNSSSTHSETNKKRIQYLFDNDLFDLPNSERPACHRDKKHSYVSVYGRMFWDKPSPTITGGFGSTGQGRFVHPLLPRTITPHEACRLQFVPDFFTFPKTIGRRSMQQIIGNAAPPRLSWVITKALIDQGCIE